MVVNVIVNLVASGGKAAKRWQNFLTEAKSAGITLIPHFTEYHGHAITLGRRLVEEGVSFIAVFGGDGTLNEVANGIILDDQPINPNLKISYIGAGSSCDFLKMFPCQSDPIKRLMGEKSYLIDVVKLECRDFNGSPLTRYFLVNSSVGIISRSIELFNRNTPLQKCLKQVNIDIAVLYAGFKNIITYPYFPAEIQIDNNLIRLDLKNFTVFKSPYFGGGMHYGKPTTPDDGLLHLALIKGCGVVRTILLLPDLYSGNIFNRSEALYFQGTYIKLNTPTSRVSIETDGEIVGKPPAKYSILRRILNVVI